MLVKFNGCPAETMFRMPAEKCSCRYIRTIYAIRNAIAKYNMKTQWWTGTDPKTLHFAVVWAKDGETCSITCWDMYKNTWNIEIIED